MVSDTTTQHGIRCSNDDSTSVTRGILTAGVLLSALLLEPIWFWTAALSCCLFILVHGWCPSLSLAMMTRKEDFAE
jgi:hypothetical protein